MADVNVAQHLEGLRPAMNKVKNQAATLNGSLGFDPEVLSKRYAAEKNARLEPGHKSTYRHALKSGLSHFLDDPWSDSRIIRDPVIATHEAVIVGGGYGGLLMAVRLLEAGINDILIVEKGSDFGGTWYWNRYPGAQCDIESYIYMPLQEELGYVAKEKYARGPELYQHARNIGNKYNLYDKTLFQTEVKSFKWEDEASIWTVETQRGDKLQAQWIIPAAGPLHTPKFPGVPGIEDFEGASFHTCRWDYNYSRGTHYGNLTGLSDKRVAIVGTGASAIQVVPRVGEWAKHLYVFQRTPSSVDVRNNRATDPDWARSLKPGWQQARMDNFNCIVSGVPTDVDMVKDKWTEISRAVAGGFGAGDDTVDVAQLAAKMQLADYQQMEKIRARVQHLVKDPDAAEALKPWYNQFCKRPCFHDEYLQTFNRPNVTLVNTHGRGVEAVTKKGIIANGKEIELDCIIYATGFEWQQEWSHQTGTQIYGRKGLTITEKWADGVSTFHGWGINGFPNLLMVSIAQSGSTPNYVHSANYMSQHFAYIVKSCKDRGIRTIEPSPEAEEAWVQEILKVGAPRAQFLKECTPGYYNEEGKMSDKVTRANPYGGGGVQYLNILTEWRKEDKMAGLQKTPVEVSPSY
ncbi:hypothetical protein E8E14_009876 [Neopestalotiopsis sp. 37M]|nr:hypothetical protein E8E14_009876 [Neopestalotiopsis sp. 37M]